MSKRTGRGSTALTPVTARVTEPVWFVYVVRTRRDALYTGIALDVDRRLEEHAGPTRRGARSLRGQTPLTLVHSARIGTRGEALRVEAMIKRMRKAEKERLVAGAPSGKRLLALLAERR